MMAGRAKPRGVNEADDMSGNLLGLRSDGRRRGVLAQALKTQQASSGRQWKYHGGALGDDGMSVSRFVV
jgi:hypothetical protein